MTGIGAGPSIPDVQVHVGRVIRSWGWFALFGVLSMMVGILVLVWPKPTLVVLAVILGILLILFGAMQLLIAFGLRRATPV
jgi:uncharacterized membrane protein HdeD (DUF308 family)